MKKYMNVYSCVSWVWERRYHHYFQPPSFTSFCNEKQRREGDLVGHIPYSVLCVCVLNVSDELRCMYIWFVVYFYLFWEIMIPIIDSVSNKYILLLSMMDMEWRMIISLSLSCIYKIIMCIRIRIQSQLS
jgi:hypothetical protein